ncbi:MAG: dihydrolipoamide acetyltransferase family protein [Actinomycetota bacterium]|nr:dihydrolipoamide acetyltransferase family protein [Actinomycetota bacterium]
MADVVMPQLGETVTEGTITKWLKKVGDKVAIDEILFEVSTDKVDSEVPSTASGYLSQILAQEGDTVAVGTVIAVLSDAPGEPAAAPAPEAAPEPAPAPAPAAFEAPAAQPAPERAAAVPHVEGMVLSPVVRRLLDENGIDPSAITGTGAGGRITRNDVLDYLDKVAQGQPAPAPAPAAFEAPAAQPAPAPAPAPEPAPAPAAFEAPAAQPAPAPAQVLQPAVRAEAYAPVVAGARDEVIPFNNIRRRTAEHMVRSKATSAHTLVAIEVDFEPVERVRHALKESFAREEGFSLTYLPFIARATVEALRTFPHLNASVGDDALVVHRDLNLSIAVDLDLDGLIAPVIKEADQKRLKGLAREIRDLATRARSKRLSADELAGGTFTITNPGPYGTFITAPIINQPQVAILSTDGVKRKPVVVTLPDGTESIAIHSVGVLALTFDHRVIDGAYAAAYLARMKEIIETWNWAQEF